MIRVGEKRARQRQCGRSRERGAYSLPKPRCEEREEAGAESARDGGEPEERHAGCEGAAGAEEIAEPPTQDERAAKGEAVTCSDEGELQLVEAELPLDRGQSHCDERNGCDEAHLDGGEQEEGGALPDTIITSLNYKNYRPIGLKCAAKVPSQGASRGGLRGEGARSSRKPAQSSRLRASLAAS